MSVDIGIVGLARSGKTTVFNALTRGKASPEGARTSIGTAKVPDPRLEAIAGILRSKRVVPAETRYLDVGATVKSAREGLSGELLNRLSQVDALINVVGSFNDERVPPDAVISDVARDIADTDLELVLSDLTIIERRLEKIQVSLKGAKSTERQNLEHEQSLLAAIRQGLEKEVPLREQELNHDETRAIANYQFLSAKPLLIVVNIGEAQLPRLASLETELDSRYRRPKRRLLGLCGQLEMELSELDEAEAGKFRAEMGLSGEPGPERVIRSSYDLLGLITFFTTVSEEVRAWPLPGGTTALKAAGRIHTDMERGFIRAEVISYDELTRCGSLVEARRHGLLRLEGKNYPVRDGDIITFLFNV